MKLEYEYNVRQQLKKAEDKIKKAIADGNKVWIKDKNGNQVILDENCEIGFMKFYSSLEL